jgi:acylphosphatase
VGFRYFVQRKANVLALRGWVRNRWEGTVEVMARGERKNLDTFLSFLKKGPSGANVTNIEVKWLESAGEFTDFKVRRTT